MQTESVKISALVFDPANARKHDDKNLDAIKGSLSRFGQQKPIVVGKNNVVIAGNGTLAAAKALGWDKIDVVRTELTGPEATAFALADNRTAELASWDDEILGKTLQALQEDGFPIADIGFDPGDFFDDKGTDGLTDPDEVPEIPQNVRGVQRGQIWQLGDHRMMCGDSTSKEDVERLMGGEKADLWLTDPPYGVAYESAGRREKSNQHRAIENDAKPIDEMGEFWTKAAANAHSACSNEASYYWFACQGGDQMMMMMSIGRANWKVRHELIWIKDQMVFGRSDYHYKHEPILYGWKQDGKHNWYSDRKQTSLLEFARPKKSDEHPTMKPVDLIEYLIGNNTKSKHLVLDTFSGSGSTLIACEKTGRKCFGMEIDPHYCSVILERWEKFTGKKAVLLTGKLQEKNGKQGK